MFAEFQKRYAVKVHQVFFASSYFSGTIYSGTLLENCANIIIFLKVSVTSSYLNNINISFKVKFKLIHIYPLKC